jgi:hypothetical protein
MNASLHAKGLLATLRHVLGRVRRENEGASLVQFIVVLPVFVLVVMGLWAMFQTFSAHQTLCEAVQEASRYLQVEGPLLDENLYPYPAGWETLAIGIVNQELKSNAAIQVGPIAAGDLDISPDDPRTSPQDSQDVSAENVPNNWFFIRASTVITNPLAIFVPGTGPGGGLKLTCKGTGFFEGPPIAPTKQVEGQKCDPPQGFCTRIPPGPTWTPTACPDDDRQCGCAVCNPRG